MPDILNKSLKIIDYNRFLAVMWAIFIVTVVYIQFGCQATAPVTVTHPDGTTTTQEMNREQFTQVIMQTENAYRQSHRRLVADFQEREASLAEQAEANNISFEMADAHLTAEEEFIAQAMGAAQGLVIGAATGNPVSVADSIGTAFSLFTAFSTIGLAADGVRRKSLWRKMTPDDSDPAPVG